MIHVDENNIITKYVQYKFNVDGEWRHDEHKQFMHASFGAVNTIFVEQPYILPSILNAGLFSNHGIAGTSSGSHMELGHFVPGHMVSFFSHPIFSPCIVAYVLLG